MGGSLLQVIHQGGVAMYPLLLCSVLTVAIALERAAALRRARASVGSLAKTLGDCLRSGDEAAAEEACRATPAPLGPVALAGLAKVGRSREEIEETMEHAAATALQDLESNIPVLGTIGGTAPFIGLLGTVLGIMRAFHSIRLRGQAGTAVVAGGVSEALIATATGLVVAVVAVVAYNVFLNRVSRIEVRLDAARSELLYVFMEGYQCAQHDRHAMRVETA